MKVVAKCFTFRDVLHETKRKKKPTKLSRVRSTDWISLDITFIHETIRLPDTEYLRFHVRKLVDTLPFAAKTKRWYFGGNGTL